MVIFKKFSKKAIIGSSVFVSVLATGLSTGLLSHTTKTEKQTVSNAIDYHEEINKNTEQVKQTIQKTPRNDLLKMLDGFSNHNSDKSSLKSATATVQTKDEKYNEQYAINNLSITEKNKIVDLTYKIGSGAIAISDLIQKAEKAKHADLNQLIAQTTNDDNKQIPELKNKTTYFLSAQSYSNTTNYSNEQLQALAALIDPNYLAHLRQRSTYLVSYATILGVATAAAWGVAAYYWTCWWMFGGNIPFAIAATVQAGLMTADMGIAWADYAFNELTIKNILNLRNKPLYDFFRYGIKGEITITKIANFLYKNEILFGGSGHIENLILWAKSFIEKFKDKALRTIVAKTGIRSGIAGTSWASPIGLTVISAISFVLSISNFIINIFWN